MSCYTVVALISGGKDSLFSILHCIANGHKVVALANLHPPLPLHGNAEDDLDSYMYQTIGHEVIPLYERALELPLYRQEIIGTARNVNKTYSPIIGEQATEQDETESLLPLLQKVVAAHPEVNGVSTGAILSDYQRTRVESVALRLGLTPLSYLWQWPSLPPHTESSLLEDMAAVGQDSRIIKVASGGLDDNFLWENVAAPGSMARLANAARRFGLEGDGALLGEGGEYETLAVNGPAMLWKGRIEVVDDRRVTVQGEAGSSSLRIRQPQVVPKEDDGYTLESVRKPSLWDARFEDIIKELADNDNQQDVAEDDHQSCTEPASLNNASDGNDSVDRSFDSLVFLPDLTGKGPSASEQMRVIMEEAMARLAAIGHCADDIAYTSITLRAMADFPAINAVYGSFFTNPNPPARATIACASVLPLGAHVAVALTSVKPSAAARTGLHVQSLSYWAPANIGPYSQAIAIGQVQEGEDAAYDLIYVAGKIPLIPATMALGFPRTDDATSTSNLQHQSALALQHLHRLGRVMKVRQWAGVIASVVADNPQDLRVLAGSAYALWRLYHCFQDEQSADSVDEDENFDVWDAVHRPDWSKALPTSSHKPSSGIVSIETIPEVHVVRVDELPRGASIEWVGYGLTTDARVRPDIPHLRYLLRTFDQRIVQMP